jgi:hypothetical protein
MRQTIFSMSFFTLNVNEETGQRHWLISDRFWIYCEFPLRACVKAVR